jgi:serine/threonine protein kinase
MAPEVFRGDQHYGGPVDVYSFGIVLWELTTRARPWEAEFGETVREAAFFAALNLALQTGRRPGIPVDIEVAHPRYVALLRRCWAGDPVDRPVFADAVPELAACLREVCNE